MKKLPIWSEQIRELAHEKRLTQKELRDTAQISRTAISHYLKGLQEPRFSVLQKWGAAYHVNMNWLFYGEGEMSREQEEPSDPQILQYPVQHIRKSSGEAPNDPPKEVVIQKSDAAAYEAQGRLIDLVCQSLAKNGADQKTIRRAILALISGAL